MSIKSQVNKNQFYLTEPTIISRSFFEDIFIGNPEKFLGKMRLKKDLFEGVDLFGDIDPFIKLFTICNNIESVTEFNIAPKQNFVSNDLLSGID
jgi:hypothetical protein